jgi:3-hydroxyisobutyrate dehydrogenase-like beta-hydroxyacid dehydrogenase
MNDIFTVGYIGLGHAGWPMAANVGAAGYRLVVRDADAARARAFADEHGATVADGPDAFADAEVIVTMLPNGDVVREVLLGEEGIAGALAPGTVVIDTSSSDPLGTRELGAQLAGMGVHLVDAPVSQPELGGLRDGRITLMVGGDDEAALDRATPVLESMCTWLFRMGGLGAGHAMKTLNNYTSAASIVALADSLVVGHRFGLDPAQMLDVLNVSTGRNFSSAYAFRDEGLPRRYESDYTLALLVKDVGIAANLIESMGFESELPALLRGYLAEALDALGTSADHTEVLRHWEQRAGVQLPTPPVPEHRVPAGIPSQD